MKPRRLLAVLLSAVVLVGWALPAAALGGSYAIPQKIEVSQLDGEGKAAAFKPKAADLESYQAVVIELSDRSLVDEIDYRASAGKSMEKHEQKAYVTGIKGKQAEIVKEVVARGGKVVAQYQRAYNGIAARIKGKDIQSIAAMPGVAAIHPVQKIYLDNETSVPFIGADDVWQMAAGGLPVDGRGIKVAVIDTGIDYTHATFGGPGTAEAYETNDPNVVEAGTFPTAKVVGGWDFAGTNYDADDPSAVPVPDPDPLDENGHGTHVAGTIAGFGVANSAGGYKVGPGVAPGALLYAYKVFGREGTTDLVAAAIEMALDPDQDGDLSDRVDVINMSLGSPFGSPTDPSAVAAQAATRLGVIVVASAGNSGNIPYITGSPGVAPGVISVASSLDNGIVYNAIMVNSPSSIAGLKLAVEAAITPPLAKTGPKTGDLVYCGLAVTPDQVPASVAGKIALIDRGVCTFAQKILNAQSKGAIAVVVANNQPGDPIVMGGDPTGINIPAVMIRNVDGAAIKSALASGPVNVTLSADLVIPKPELADTLSTFTSRGPGRTGYANIKGAYLPEGGTFKPEIAAPGQDIRSAAVGSGDEGVLMSGTSMASPHVAGVAALMRQLHPDWKVEEIKAALMNTATCAKDLAGVPYSLTLQGAGRVRVDEAAKLEAVALPGGLAFGSVAVTGNKTSAAKDITVVNKSDENKTYTVTWEFLLPSFNGAGVTVSVPSTLAVPAHEKVKLPVRLTFDPALLNDANPLSNFDKGLNEYCGYIVLTGTDGEVLKVPFTVLPYKACDVKYHPSSLNAGKKSQVALDNKSAVDGYASFFPLLGVSAKDKALPEESDIKYVGARPVPGTAGSVLEFAVATYGPWCTLETNEFDFLIDMAADGTVDYILFCYDLGYVTSGTFNGRVASFLYNAATGVIIPEYYVGYYGASFNTSVVSLYVDAADLGLDAASGMSVMAVPAVYAFGREATDGVTCQWPALDLASMPWQVSAEDLYLPAGGRATAEFSFGAAPGQSILVLVPGNADKAGEASVIEVRSCGNK